MSETLNLQCTCGRVKAEIKNFSPAKGNHIICLCEDCQAFARYLKRADIMDANGGTEILQIAPYDMNITQGAEELRCVKLTANGLIRWYTNCCKTPAANTVGSKLPFAGVVHNFIARLPGAASLDSLLGPITARIQGKHGYGALPADTHQSMQLKTMWRISKILIGAKLSNKKHSPFFDKATGAPLSTPVVLSSEQREQLRHQKPI